jgi:hypothetical protein
VERQEQTVGELVQEIRTAVNRMGVNNPHRYLLMRVGNALISVAKRNASLTDDLAAAKDRQEVGV